MFVSVSSSHIVLQGLLNDRLTFIFKKDMVNPCNIHYTLLTVAGVMRLILIYICFGCLKSSFPQSLGGNPEFFKEVFSVVKIKDTGDR